MTAAIDSHRRLYEPGTFESSDEAVEAEIVNQLNGTNATARLSALESVIKALKTGRSQFSFGLFSAVADVLESDRNSSIRRACVDLAHAAINSFGAGPQLDAAMKPLLPSLVQTVGDRKVELRKEVLQTLHAYMLSSTRVQYILQVYCEVGLESDEDWVQTEAAINLPVLLTREFAKEDLSNVVQCLVELLGKSEEWNKVAKSLERIRQISGEQVFRSYIEQMPANLQNIYKRRMATASVTYGDRSSPTLSARELVVKLTGHTLNDVDSAGFGVIRRDVMTRLSNPQDWSVRFGAIEELKSDLTLLSDLRVLMPHLKDFINFLSKFLVDEVNFKITMSALEIFIVVIKKLGVESSQYVGPLATALTSRVGDSKIVIRQLNARAFKDLMYASTPMLVLKHILSHLNHKNSRAREETLNIVITALLIFPTTDFDFTALCEAVSPCLVDSKRRVRQASLECIAVLAQLMGVNNLRALIDAIEALEPTHGDAPMNAVKARIARRQLPMIKDNGMIDYATNLRTITPAPDIEWINRAAGMSRGGRTMLEGGESADPNTSNVSSASSKRGLVLSAGRSKAVFPWNGHGNDDQTIGPNGFKKPVIPPPVKPTWAKKISSDNEDVNQLNLYDTNDTVLSSGYSSMTGRPGSDTVNAGNSKLDTDVFMKPQLVRSASRDKRGVHNYNDAVEIEDVPLDEKALNAVRNSAAKKKAERKVQSAETNNDGTRKENIDPKKHNFTSETAVQHDVEVKNSHINTSINNAVSREQKLKALNKQHLYNAEEDVKYHTAPAVVFNSESNDNFEVSGSARRKIDGVKEARRREFEERKRGNQDSQDHVNTLSYSLDTGGDHISAPSSAPIAGKPPHTLRRKPIQQPQAIKQRPQPLKASPEVELRRSMSQLHSDDWAVNIEGLYLLQQLAEQYTDVVASQIHEINLALTVNIRNLRSQVARQAIDVMRCLFKHLERRMDPDLELTVGCLLTKTGESNGFIRDDVEKCLGTMAEKVTPTRAIQLIASVGAQHKNKEIRKCASYILTIIIERVLDVSRGVKSKETLQLALPTVALFCLDSGQETRYYGRKMLDVMLDDDANFEHMILKYVQPQNVHPIKKIIENLKANGLGEHPNETPSAKLSRRPSQQFSRTQSGGSNVGRASSAEQNGEMSATHPMRKRNTAKRLTENDKDMVNALVQQLTSSDFREREEGITLLNDLAKTKTVLVGQNINQIFDGYIPRLTDNNSKINHYALTSMMKLVPLLRDYFSAVTNMVIPQITANMASNKAELRSIALDVIDIMTEHIDQGCLLQPLCLQARQGNNRVRPDIVLKISNLVTCLYARKPAMVSRHALPLLWHLVSNLNGSGAAPGASGNLRQSTSHFATTLHTCMGDHLLKEADSQLLTPRLKLTLKQLIEVT